MSTGYAIIRKCRIPAPTDCRVLDHLPSDLDKYGGICAFDFETHGTDPVSGSIRSISLANDYGTVAIDLQTLSQSDRKWLTKWLLKQKLVAHNAVFDAAWIYAKSGMMPNIEACTLVLFKLLSTEGFLGQQWGLKVAMRDVLGWEESNEKDLYAWLKSNKLKASDMAQAPWDILGKYNALDSAATWQLYKYFLKIIEDNDWKECLLDFHRQDFVNLIELTIEQQKEGMKINIDALTSYDERLKEEIEEKKQEFIRHPRVAPELEFYKRCVVEEFKKTIPPQFKKDGKTTTARFTRWEHKLEELRRSQPFNVDSPQQLQWLLYERLMIDCPIKTDKGLPSTGKKALPHLGELGKLLKAYRELRDRRKFIKSLQGVMRDGRFHPKLKIHGTVTGRSSGGVEE